MLTVLRNPTYAKLFSAQMIALLGTGLLTVALGLLAFDIAGGDAGIVMGVALSIKMIAYVAVSPVTAALTARLPRRAVLVGADLVRAAVAVSLPFVTEAWQIYVLIFLLQSASATFTPAFQAVIPSILPGERDFTRALSLSRLAYDLESLVSPVLAAALLTVISYHSLFVGTVVGFVGSAALVLASRFPRIDVASASPFIDRLTRGTRLFWASGELRGLLGLNLVVASSTAMVIVNTPVLVLGGMGRAQTDVALLLAAYGCGSMLVALTVPALLEKVSDRLVMVTGAVALPLLLVVTAGVLQSVGDSFQWLSLVAVWVMLGAATSAILTPSARLLRRGADEQDRPAVFAAQFSLSHACFLLTYPFAGVLGTAVGLPTIAILLACVGVVGTALALREFTRLRASVAVSQ